MGFLPAAGGGVDERAKKTVFYDNRDRFVEDRNLDNWKKRPEERPEVFDRSDFS